MSQEDRPSKRPRTAETDDAAEIPLKHHEEFWLDDGSVVLVARNVGFRVYRGLLVTQSTVFADMFASSSPIADKAIDGCPVVHVSDSPEDLAHLLRVLLPTTQRRFHPEQGPPERTFEEVYAVITLAHKYNIEDVQRQALYCLRQYTFNDDFDIWQAKGTCPEAIKVDGPCAIGAVNIARLLDVPQMLPIALYKCLSLGPRIIDGWTRSDGSVEHLSQDDIKRCISALQELSSDRVAYTYRTYYGEVSEDCKRHKSCKDALRAIPGFMMQHDPDFFSDGSDVMESYIPVLVDVDLCASCAQAVKDREAEARRMFWDNLPCTLDLAVENWGNGI